MYYYFIILPLRRVGRAIDDYGIIVQDPRVLAYLNTFKGGPSFPLPCRDWGSSLKERRNAGVEALCMDLFNSSKAFFFLLVLTLYLRVKSSFFFLTHSLLLPSPVNELMGASSDGLTVLCTLCKVNVEGSRVRQA